VALAEVMTIDMVMSVREVLIVNMRMARRMMAVMIEVRLHLVLLKKPIRRGAIQCPLRANLTR
jgi:hypothetical protein